MGRPLVLQRRSVPLPAAGESQGWRKLVRTIDTLGIVARSTSGRTGRDVGGSVPLAVPHTAPEIKLRSHIAEGTDNVIYEYPLKFLSRCPKSKFIEN